MESVIYFLICFAHPIFIPTPEIITVMMGSVLIGKFQSFILSFIGILSGILLIFSMIKWGSKRFLNIENTKLEKYKRYVKNNEIISTGILFILPIIPDEAICLGAGVIGISFKSFFLVATVSKLITTFLGAYIL